MAPHTELHCHSAYSFGDGASTPDELASAAVDLGIESLALTDHDNVCGAMEFAHACKGVGVRPIHGAELTIELPGSGGAGHPQPGRHSESSPRREPRTGHLTVLVEGPAGWRSLCRLLTESHRGTRPKPGRDPLPPSISLDQLEADCEGLVCLSGCAREGAVLTCGPDDAGPAGGEGIARRLLNVFGPDRFRIELQRPLWRRDRARNHRLTALSERLGVPSVATGDAHVHHRSRSPLQDALVAARMGATLEETESARRGNSASVLLGPGQSARRFPEHPGALAESRELAERLRFDLTSELGYSYPGAGDPGAQIELAGLCRARIEDRYRVGDRVLAGARITSAERAEAERRLDAELALIARLGLSGFFLLHHEILVMARQVAAEVRGPDSARSLLPPGRGRGSSVSSIVCYLTGLSHIDPVRNDLFIGRFLNDDMNGVPDIDLDFPRDIRRRLIPLVHKRYGDERAALVAAFATYRSRGAVRDLGKALGLPPGEIERLARAVDVYAADELAPLIEQVLGPRAASPRWRALAKLVPELCGLPRHISQHPGGMVISTRPLTELCPMQPAAMEGRKIIQWDKDSCADAGFLKIDLLGLGMLSAVERCVDEIARARGERIDLSRIPLDDPDTWSTIQRAETAGVFQIESRAQMQMLPRTLPENLDDLTVQVALVRPGPIQGGAVHPYIERRKALRADPDYKVPYEHPLLEEALADTLGAIVFQDQVLEVSIALAGFSAGEAEGLRRAMSRKRSEAALLRYRRRFIEGAVKRGVELEVAERIFAQVQGFSGFGFPKSHSAAFGLLAYQSTWLRVHYGPELLCALLNEQPMGFYPPDALVHESQRRGIEVLPPDVNLSELECRVETVGSGPGSAGMPPVRIGLGYVAEVATEDAEAVIAERRGGGGYRSIAELAGRSGASRSALRHLAWAGACDRLVDVGGGPVREAFVSHSGRNASRTGFEGAAIADGAHRRPALWAAGAVAPARKTADGIQLSLALDSAEPAELPPLGPWERALADYQATGMTLADHPMELLRPGLGDGFATSRELASITGGRRVQVGGMVVARQRPGTAKGVVFMLLEDELGMINLIVPPPVARRYRLVLRSAGFVAAAGKLEHREGTTNVLVSRLTALEPGDGAEGAPRRKGEHGLPEGRAPAGSTPSQDGSDRAVEQPGATVPGLHGPPSRVRAAALAELASALPARQSFGRRAR